jgi:hypothetical protein
MSAHLQTLTRELTEDRQALAVKGFFRIMEKWHIDTSAADQILGKPVNFMDWKRGDVHDVDDDVLTRIGHVAGIWKALNIVYSNPEHADTWVHRPNMGFGGQTPLARMTMGEISDLVAVRAYLDAARAPWS